MNGHGLFRDFVLNVYGDLRSDLHDASLCDPIHNHFHPRSLNLSNDKNSFLHGLFSWKGIFLLRILVMTVVKQWGEPQHFNCFMIGLPHQDDAAHITSLQTVVSNFQDAYWYRMSLSNGLYCEPVMPFDSVTVVAKNEPICFRAYTVWDRYKLVENRPRWAIDCRSYRRSRCWALLYLYHSFHEFLCINLNSTFKPIPV